MCRWLAYSGTPILPMELLYKPEHSLIDQSRHARMGVETTNGDGFGLGWYAEPGDPDQWDGQPALFRGNSPAWSDVNLRELSGRIHTGLFFAHIRASTGSPVQQTNCHPFRHGRWMWMHNGAIAHFAELHRELLLAVDPSLYPSIQGSTDSELMFYLSLTLGLEHDPVHAVERMIGLVEQTADKHGIPDAMQMTVATSDGVRTWGFRYSTSRRSRSLFYSTDVNTLRRLHPDFAELREVSEDTRIVVSEPLGPLSGAWQAVPESSYGVVQPGDDEIHPLVPRAA
jgi:glutamine amidotransferase